MWVWVLAHICLCYEALMFSLLHCQCGSWRGSFSPMLRNMRMSLNYKRETSSQCCARSWKTRAGGKGSSTATLASSQTTLWSCSAQRKRYVSNLSVALIQDVIDPYLSWILVLSAICVVIFFVYLYHYDGLGDNTMSINDDCLTDKVHKKLMWCCSSLVSHWLYSKRKRWFLDMYPYIIIDEQWSMKQGTNVSCLWLFIQTFWGEQSDTVHQHLYLLSFNIVEMCSQKSNFSE